MRRLPLPLAVILAVALVHSLAWSVLLPPLQGQDEISHVAYTQKIAETGVVPWTAVTDVPDVRPYSTELGFGELYSGAGPLELNVAARPLASRIDERRWDRVAATLTDAQRGDGGLTASMRNPPLYYLTQSLVYLPLSSTGLFTRLEALRWATIPWFLLAVAGAWLFAGELFARRRWMQAVVALVVALQPMLAQLGGISNPDAMIAALWALALWLTAAIVNRGVTRGRIAGAVLVTVAAVLTQPRAAPAAVPLVLAFAARGLPGVWRRGRPARVAVAGAGVLAALLVVAAGDWYTLHGDVTLVRTREFASYLWQFYLPRPGWMRPTVQASWDVRDVFVDRLWSGFVQLEVNLPRSLLDVISKATMIGAALTVAALAVRRDAVRRHGALVAILVVSFLVSMYALHVAAWHELPITGDPILTGRYLTPWLPVAGAAVVAVAAALPRRIGPAAATVVLGLETLVALSALGTALVRFYA